MPTLSIWIKLFSKKFEDPTVSWWLRYVDEGFESCASQTAIINSIFEYDKVSSIGIRTQEW